ncbi:hypothetical protein [Sulfitobacter sp. EhC04]|uniref:hypothetical protein n=1 Tax=Sulfitobacter sp. EhC04 TaxID=1849168 RepID=UPI0010FD9BB2|nr:hypothetical protein [Sulfitobacter sp. EhC04]
MIKMVFALGAAFTMAGFSALAQSKTVLVPGPTAVLDAQTVEPIGRLKVYAKKPSAWFGNAFNEELGEIEPLQKFSVSDVEEIGSFKGSDVWVKLDSGEIAGQAQGVCSQGCWAYLGAKDSGAVPLTEDQLGQTGIEYGNFIFID